MGSVKKKDRELKSITARPTGVRFATQPRGAKLRRERRLSDPIDADAVELDPSCYRCEPTCKD